ncbi:hypothetical protein [Intrasporangium sp.]|uniref:hypothetical protein n=1 Tax=Intrasporangium sp. TaxID=1925024 RepID=UPI0026475A75|nr:hypothetical protein [Intrasporangium sp.]
MTAVTERALARSPGPARHEQAPLLVLSQPDFQAAVRRALRDLDRPDRLSVNPLTRSRAVHERAGDGESPEAVLRELLREQTDALAADAKAFRAVDRTYWHRCPSQEAAAQVLGLPFSTYRRHLSHGIELLSERLWNLDVYGRPVVD